MSDYLNLKQSYTDYTAEFWIDYTETRLCKALDAKSLYTFEVNAVFSNIVIKDMIDATRELVEQGHTIETETKTVHSKGTRASWLFNVRPKGGLGCGAVYEFIMYSAQFNLGVFTDNIDQYKKLTEDLLAKIKSLSLPKDESMYPLTFVYRGTQDMESTMREVRLEPWSDIKDNYPQCGKAIETLINHGQGRNSGSLIIWTGQPGTGKTYALRSLIREWSNTQFYVIVDPESYLDNTSTLINTIMYEMRDNDMPEGSFSTDSEKKVKNSPKTTTCLVMEDAPNFILTESRQHRGDLISKMLNATSGLLGQGTNLKILVTTNEKIDKIDEAFLRPGRLLQRLNIDRFTPDQAKAWLDAKGYEGKFSQSELTLAELYQLINKDEIQSSVETETLGF